VPNYLLLFRWPSDTHGFFVSLADVLGLSGIKLEIVLGVS
jgi:hypothetical protein